MHIHQQKILKKLRYTRGSINYNSLRDKTLDPKQNAYHLKKLVDLDLVTKTVDGYKISERGKVYLHKYKDDADNKYLSETYILLVIGNTQGEFLAVKRKRHPFYGKIGNPILRVPYNNTIEETLNSFKQRYEIINDIVFIGVLDYVYELPKFNQVPRSIAMIYYLKIDSLDIDEGEGEYLWTTENELVTAKNAFVNTTNVYNILNSFKSSGTPSIESQRFVEEL